LFAADIEFIFIFPFAFCGIRLINTVFDFAALAIGAIGIAWLVIGAFYLFVLIIFITYKKCFFVIGANRIRRFIDAYFGNFFDLGIIDAVDEAIRIILDIVVSIDTSGVSVAFAISANLAGKAITTIYRFIIAIA
jgi:hypothetical protein